VTNRVGYILLDAGLRFNKLSITTIRELKRAFAQVEADQAVRVIVLSGYPGESKRPALNNSLNRHPVRSSS